MRVKVKARIWFWIVVLLSIIFTYVLTIYRWLLLRWLLLELLLLGWLLLASKITTKLPWEKMYAWAFLATNSCHRHSTLASQTCESLHQLWTLPHHETILLFKCSGIQFFNSHSHVTYRTPCHARVYSHSCLGKQRISLGVAIILNMCLCSHA